MSATILQDLVVVMVVAAAVTIVFYRLRQPVVLGYLAAGLLIGPHSSRLSLVQDPASIEGLAELGIIFLMFAVGLEFNLQKLRKVGVRAAVAAILQVSLVLLLGYAAGRWMGWSPMDSVFLGAVVSISSTTIIVKVLTEMGRLKEGYAELVIGVLVIEDLAAIALVAVLSGLGASSTLDAGVALGSMGGILLFIFIFVCVGLVLVPRLIDVVSKFHVEEVLVITVVGLAFGAALLAADLGFSVSLGAFLMGAIVAESRAVRRVDDKIAPLRDLFVAVFFVAVGMLLDPRVLLQHWQPILVVTAVALVGRTLIATATMFLAGYDGRTAVKVGTTMGQIGEFSFIIAALGLTLGVVRPELHGIAVAVCALTSLATPFTIRMGPVVADALAPRMPTWLARVLASYTRLLRRARHARHDPLARKDERRSRHGTRVAVYAAWLLGLLLVASFASHRVGTHVGRALSLGEEGTRAAAALLFGLAALPLLVAFGRATEMWALAGAKQRAMRPDRLGQHESTLDRPHIVARAAGALASAALVAASLRIAWAVHPLALPNAPLLALVVALVALVGYRWRRALLRVHAGMERTLDDLMGATPEDHHQNLRERLPWGMDVTDLRVGTHSRGAYSSLKNLRLREHTGASVLSIERRGSAIPNPSADVVLLPGDRLVLVGSKDQLSNACTFTQTPLPRTFERPARQEHIAKKEEKAEAAALRTPVRTPLRAAPRAEPGAMPRAPLMQGGGFDEPPGAASVRFTRPRAGRAGGRGPGWR